MDIWMPIKEFPKYSVNPDGLIKNHKRDTIVKGRQNRQGIVMVNLSRGNHRLTRSVALIVAEAYLQPPRNEAYNSIIYLDGDRGNCQANNLMWRPRWYAIRYHAMFDKEPINVSVLIEDTGEIFGTLREACMKYGLVEDYTYVDLCNGDRCFHYGFIFKRETGY